MNTQGLIYKYYYINRKLMWYGGRLIYFIECGDFVKIGHTEQRISARLKSLQSANPHELKLLFAGRGTFEQEQALHRELWDHHYRGEWFRKSPEFKEALERAIVEVSKWRTPTLTEMEWNSFACEQANSTL